MFLFYGVLECIMGLHYLREASNPASNMHAIAFYAILPGCVMCWRYDIDLHKCRFIGSRYRIRFRIGLLGWNMYQLFFSCMLIVVWMNIIIGALWLHVDPEIYKWYNFVLRAFNTRLACAGLYSESVRWKSEDLWYKLKFVVA